MLLQLPGLFSLLAAANALQYPLQKAGPLITHDIDQFINAELSRWNSSGLSVAVVRRDTTEPGAWNIEFGSYGIAQVDGAPVTPDTLFAIASNSKLFLSLSVGLLIKNESLAVARGERLRWDTKIKSVIPEWGLMDEEMERGVMIQDMLSHRTGIPRHDSSGFARKGGVSEMISTLRFLRPSAALREQHQYNNLMYETLSHLPPTLLNQSFESYIAEHLFAPLGMDASTYSVAEAEARGTLAHGFQWDMQDWLVGVNGTRTATVPYFQRPGEEKIWAGAGGVLTSARDLSTWVAMLLNNGRHPYTNETVVPEDVVEHVAFGVSVARGKAAFPELSPTVYGCGQDRYSYRGHEIIEHAGSNPGFKTQVARFPHGNLGIVVLSNDESGSHIIQSVKWKIADHVLGLAPIDWANRYGAQLADKIRKNQAVTPRPSSPVPPSAPFSAMEGTFAHGAYPALRPCFVPARPAPRSAACTALLSTPAVQRILGAPAPARDAAPTLIAAFKSFFATHMRLTHFSGNIFNASLIWANGDARAAEGFPAGGDVVVGLDERYVAEWVGGGGEGEDGWAFSGDFWGKDGDVRPLEGGARDTAEVWFGRVGAD
ncbi:beta-lactamase/transpeptidase-like protein [Mycena belliarum]|uniref:Beta-lactamase/transpeptidase-like protein n=1 Tax=Mycena belliarum TaxID=1033014 RepID=A0AAD6UCC1_9AGAR|nr:beta-lactamase/transpeptidase-like protein [Mycena belliae]